MGHRDVNDVGIVDLLCEVLMEEIGVGSPSFQSRFHGRCGNREVEETDGGRENF